MKNCLEIAALLNEEERFWLKGFLGPNWMLMKKATFIILMIDCGVWYPHAITIINKTINREISTG